MLERSRREVPVDRLTEAEQHRVADWVAVEAALELRLAARGVEPRVLATTMRTPGQDLELAAGYLYAESIVESRADIAALAPCNNGESVRIEIAGPLPDFARLQRVGTISSACGACGKSMASLALTGSEARLADGPHVRWEILRSLPSALRQAQAGFATTGGTHACALFDADGGLLAVREDVGRHNALDKLLGYALLSDRLPWSGRILLLSGRASFELLQKAARARVPVVAAIGAPSSMAIQLAEAAGITLIGFLSARGCNVYSNPVRVLR